MYRDMVRADNPHTDEPSSQRVFFSLASRKGATSDSLDTIRIFILLAITIWVAHFWHSAEFGLYVDDYLTVSQGLASGTRVWAFVKKAVLTFEYGRPIGYALLGLFSFLGAKLAGLRGIYWLAYIIVTVNSCLFYTLLKRLSPYPGFALLGALAFSLFPADATRAFLTHLQVYPSLTFLLIAFHCYLSQRIRLSYLAILGTLLSYETAFPVFLVAPLLKRKSGSSLIRELIRHASVLAAMFGCVALIHVASGDIRVAKLGFLETLQMSLWQMILGPVMSMGMFVYRPFTTLRFMQHEPAVFLPLGVAGLAWGLSWANLGAAAVKTTASDTETQGFFKHLGELALLGWMMLVLAYPLALTVPATAINGRGSRVHIAAVIGASILCACAWLATLFAASRFRKKKLTSLGLVLFFGLLAGFGLTVQQDYRLSWQYQRAFWTDLLHLCPDIDKETVILVEPTGLKYPRHMDAFSWATSFGLQQIYQFFPNYQYFDRLRRKPQVHILRPGWQGKIASDGQNFRLDDSTTLSLEIIYGSVKSSNVIFLEQRDGKLARRTEPLIIDGQEFPLKQVASSSDKPLQKGHLYPYLIRSSNEEPVRYFK